MTTLDQSASTIQELINSCREAQETFRSAAEAAPNSVLRQLFGLYAQQRSRFAEELAGLTTAEMAKESRRPVTFLPFADETELLASCLKLEKSALALYRKALAERVLPTKAHFLVSAQLALLERVHNRIEALRPGAPAAVLTISDERVMV